MTTQLRCDGVVSRLAAMRDSYVALGRQCHASGHGRAASRHGKRAQLLEETIVLINDLRGQVVETELRLDSAGALDDVVVPLVQLFRLERMDDAAWWMRLYMIDREDFVFWIRGTQHAVDVTVERETR